MAKKVEQQSNFQNNWRDLVAKPVIQTKGNKKFNDEPQGPPPYYQKRENVFHTLFPSEAGSKYDFFIIPDKEGKPFSKGQVAQIQLFKFHSPKQNKDIFNKVQIATDPSVYFDMSVLDKAKDPNSLTEEDKQTLKNIKRHENLVQRWRDLYFTKEEGVNFKYAKGTNRYNNRLKKQELTLMFGVYTKWNGEENVTGDRRIKLIYSDYGAFQDKFTDFVISTGEVHEEDQPSWFEDYFSINNGVKGIIDVNMGSMAVGGKGATIKLVKLGKDPIDDKGVGVKGEIPVNSIVYPMEPENALSHFHYFFKIKSTEALYQDRIMDEFEEAIVQLEEFLNEKKIENALKGNSSTESVTTDQPF